MEAEEVQKTFLKKENELYKSALDSDVDEVKDQMRRVGKYALIAGGAFVGTYLLLKYLRSSKKENTIDNDKELIAGKTQVVVEKPQSTGFADILKEQLAMLMVAVVREKVSELTGIEKNKLKDKQNELTGKA